MKSDLINIFNRLTSSELADYNLFSELLENHYEKFKYLYSLIETINLTKIDKIYCKVNKNILKVFIEPQEIAHINNIIYKINKNKNNYTFSEYFKLNLIESNSTLIIEIKTKNNKKEGDIYESRFV